MTSEIDPYTLALADRCRGCAAAQRYAVGNQTFVMHREFGRSPSGSEVVACLAVTAGATFSRGWYDGSLGYRLEREGD